MIFALQDLRSSRWKARDQNMSAQNALFQSKKMTSPMQPNFNMEPRNHHIPILKKMEIKSRGYSKPTSFQIFFPTNFPTIQPEIIFNSFQNNQFFNYYQKLFNYSTRNFPTIQSFFGVPWDFPAPKKAPVPPPAMPRKPPNTRRVPRQSLARRRRGRCYLGQDGSGPLNHQYHGKNMGKAMGKCSKIG